MMAQRDDLIATMEASVDQLDTSAASLEAATARVDAAWAALDADLQPLPDTTPPVITVPADIIVIAAAGQTGKVVTFNVTTDDVTAIEHVTPASGSTFPIGVTTVQVSAIDPAGNRSDATFKVTVLPPVVVPPSGTWPTRAQVGIPQGAFTKGTYSPPAYPGAARTDGVPNSPSPARPDLKLKRQTSTLTIDAAWVAANGKIVEGFLFEAGMNIRANDVEVRYCLFRSGASSANTMIVVGTNGQTSPFTRPNVHHCEFDAGNNGDVNPIGDNAYWFHHNWVHRGHGAWANGDTLIEDCRFEDLVINAYNTSTPSHLDGVQHGISRNPAKPWDIIRRCLIDNPGNQTSCIAHFATWESPPHSLVLENNYFVSSTGRLNIAIYAGLSNSYDIRIVGNTFGSKWTNYNGTAKREPTIDHGEMFSGAGKGLWWHGNKYDDNGTTVHPEWDRPAVNAGGSTPPGY